MTVETWKFINTFAPWFSALGSISAVIVALYMARRDKKVRLEVSIGHRLILGQGVNNQPPNFVMITITNIGHREAQISNLTWRTGIFRRSYAVQIITPDA